jgi:hypothetical protein
VKDQYRFVCQKLNQHFLEQNSGEAWSGKSALTQPLARTDLIPTAGEAKNAWFGLAEVTSHKLV